MSPPPPGFNPNVINQQYNGFLGKPNPSVATSGINVPKSTTGAVPPGMPGLSQNPMAAATGQQRMIALLKKLGGK
jgi:hypothetical protein